MAWSCWWAQTENMSGLGKGECHFQFISKEIINTVEYFSHSNIISDIFTLFSVIISLTYPLPPGCIYCRSSTAHVFAECVLFAQAWLSQLSLSNMLIVLSVSMPNWFWQLLCPFTTSPLLSIHANQAIARILFHVRVLERCFYTPSADTTAGNFPLQDRGRRLMLK